MVPYNLIVRAMEVSFEMTEVLLLLDMLEPPSPLMFYGWICSHYTKDWKLPEKEEQQT